MRRPYTRSNAMTSFLYTLSRSVPLSLRGRSEGGDRGWHEDERGHRQRDQGPKVLAPVVADAHQMLAGLDHIGGRVALDDGLQPARQERLGEERRAEEQGQQRQELPGDHGQLRVAGTQG